MCDILIMAAAVADYRAKAPPGFDPAVSKLRRAGDGLSLALEPTPDLLAACAAKRGAQLLCGFALETRAELLQSARAKLERKGLDLIVANPLETMDAPTIEATVLTAAGERLDAGALGKPQFADWLLDVLEARRVGPAAGARAADAGQASEPTA